MSRSVVCARALLAVLLAGAAPPPPMPPMPDGPPPPLPELAGPPPTVPVLMHDLGATVVADGTLVAFQADLLFDGTTASLHDAAPARLVGVVQLVRQIAPSGLRITGRDPADPALARHRAEALRTWLADAGVGGLKLVVADQAGPPGLDVLILR